MVTGGPILSSNRTTPAAGANVTVVVSWGPSQIKVSTTTDRNGNISASVLLPPTNLAQITNLLNLTATATVNLSGNIIGTTTPQYLVIPLLPESILIEVGNVLNIILSGLVGIPLPLV